MGIYTNKNIFKQFRRQSFEPQFISHANAPLHYENVLTRSYDHQVLVGYFINKKFKKILFQ